MIHPTVWPQYTNVSGRQDRQTGQRSDNIGQTVLQTVAQKQIILFQSKWKVVDNLSLIDLLKRKMPNTV